MAMTLRDGTPAARRGTRLPTLLAIACGVAVTVAGVLLGQWQTRRGDDKQALQATWDAAVNAPASAIGGAAEGQAVAARLPARVQLRGVFDARGTVYVGNRMQGPATGFDVVTPLRLADGSSALVNRGWIARDARDPALMPPVTTPASEVAVEGLAVARVPRMLELAAETRARPPAIWANLAPDEYARVTGVAVPGFVVQQTSAVDDGLQRDWPRVDTGVQKHRGYALQWYALAALAGGLTAWFGARALRRTAQ